MSDDQILALCRTLVQCGLDAQLARELYGLLAERYAGTSSPGSREARARVDPSADDAVRAELHAARRDLDAIMGAPPLVDDDEARAHAGQARRLAQTIFGQACAGYVRTFKGGA